MVLFQNCVRQSYSPTKMAAAVLLRCYWKQLWSRWAITGSWEPLVCNLQRRARAHAVLVIGLYELLDNPTTQLIEPPRPWKTWGYQLTFIERCGSQTDLSFTWCLQVSVVPLTVRWFLEDFPLSFIFNTAGFVHSACTSASVLSGATRLDSMYSCPGRYSLLQSLLMFGAGFVPRSVVLSPVCTTL
jgi:hypothetical protein